MRIGIVGGCELSLEPPLMHAVVDLGAELGRRGWGMVLGVSADPVATSAAAPEVDIIEVLPRGAEPATGATDLRIVDGPGARIEAVQVLSDALVVLPGGIDVLADLLRLLTDEALGLAGKPCGVLDPTGLFDPLAEQLDSLERTGLPTVSLLRAVDPAVLLDGFAAWCPEGADLHQEVAWLRVNGSTVSLLPGTAGLSLPGGACGEPGPAALCRLLARRCSVLLPPEGLRPVATVVVPESDGVWRRVSCYRTDGAQPELPGAVLHPVGNAAACDPAAAALQDLLRRGRVC